MSQFDRLGNDMSDDMNDAAAEEYYAQLAADQAQGEVFTPYNAETDLEWAYQERMSGDEGYHGDARRCPRHPHVKTSSDDGMFDAPCYVCEGEMDMASDIDALKAWEWQFDSANPQRIVCKMFLPYIPCEPIYPTTCQDVEDNIPF